jgi:hypothetical protein
MADSIPRAEYDRMWSVIDVMLSGHSYLRDRYRRRALGLTLIVMALSVIATTLAFVSPDVQFDLGPISAPLTSWLGTLSATVFFLAIVELVVDWRGKAGAHADAALKLSSLKATFRGARETGGVLASEDVDLESEYRQTMSAIVEIPERQFLRTKVRHRRKVAVSRLIDQHEGAPLFYVRLRAMAEGLRASRKSKDQRKRGGSP